LDSDHSHRRWPSSREKWDLETPFQFPDFIYIVPVWRSSINTLVIVDRAS
jgi:hypothetical protein